MSRPNRYVDPRGYYHLYSRGNRQENIFLDDYDRHYFINVIKYAKQTFGFKLLAFCFMSNHYHLLIYSNGSNVSNYMKVINQKYAQYFNKKYKVSGHLFQDRFGSVYLDNNISIVEESFYIHDNPVKAGIVSNPSDYDWSSIKIYMGNFDTFDIVDSDIILQKISSVKTCAISKYSKFLIQYQEDIAQCDFNCFFENYNYNNLDKYTVHKVPNSEAILCILEDKKGFTRNKILMKYAHKYTSLKALCMYLMYSKCSLSMRTIGNTFSTCSSNVSKYICRYAQEITQNKKIRKEYDVLCSFIA
jgi:REP element-mobilizing transposase RayT